MDETIKTVIEVNFNHLKDNISDIKEITRDIAERLAKHEETLIRNTITVEDHKRRSDLADLRHDEFIRNQQGMLASLQQLSIKVNHVEFEFKSKIDNVEKDLAPIKAHVRTVERLTKLLIIIDENKWTIAKILGFILVVIGTMYMGGDLRSLLQ